MGRCHRLARGSDIAVLARPFRMPSSAEINTKKTPATAALPGSRFRITSACCTPLNGDVTGCCCSLLPLTFPGFPLNLVTSIPCLVLSCHLFYFCASFLFPPLICEEGQVRHFINLCPLFVAAAASVDSTGCPFHRLPHFNRARSHYIAGGCNLQLLASGIDSTALWPPDAERIRLRLRLSWCEDAMFF